MVEALKASCYMWAMDFFSLYLQITFFNEESDH